MSARGRALAATARPWAGVVVLATGFLVMINALVQYALANNARRAMDFAFTGGAAGVALVVVGAALALVEEERRSAAADAAADERLAARLTAMADGVRGGGVTSLRTLPEVVVASRWSYHDPSCAFARTDDAVELPLDEARSGRTACRLCLRELA